jgi:hypothetical protein
MIMAQPKSERNILDADYGRCPLPKTHRRLVEAHVLWHQSLDRYQQPELFNANLNATIQALRNITFVLQSEKHLLGKFEDWYGPWQERMKAHPVLRWLIAARNIVVKEGELDIASTAIVKLITWKDDILVESSIPPGTPPTLIFRNIPLLELVSKKHLPPGDLEDAAIVIERQWSVPELEGREILDALAQAYGLLSDLVLDAHMTLGNTGCISSDGVHFHFRSAYHPQGTLPCMVLGIEHRSYSAKLKTGQQLQPVRTASPISDPTIAARRYGLNQADQLPGWQTLDPLLIAQRILLTAKRMLRKDRALLRILFIREGGGAWRQVVLEAANRTEKHLLMRMIARFIESVGGDAIIDVGEVWMVPPNEAAIKAHFEEARHVPGRGEAISVLVATRDGLLTTYITPFTRGPFGGIKLGSTDETEKDCPYYLKPILDVWQAQSSRLSPDGKRIRRVWEPDPLDTCFCGGPRRFAECCKRLFDALDQRADGKRGITEARANRDLVHFEELARAELAQYVIWVKQHTSPTRHVAPELHHMFLKVDAPALTALVRQLGEALIANGHSDSFLPQLRHISKVIGVPDLSIRLTALAARWLFEIGDYAGAVKEMETLGEPERLNDTLALLLAAQLLDLPVHTKTEFLARAISGASLEYERWLAELELVRHLSDCGNRDEALRRIDSVVAELTKNSSYGGLLADAISLRWNIADEERDFQAAKTVLETSTDLENVQQFAALLIDHGDYDEAERILSGASTAGDLAAQLLIIDARIRANRIDSARELLLMIRPEYVPPHLQYPHAVAYALVALASTNDDLRAVAAAKLRQLPSIDARLTKQVNNLLEALEGHDNPPRKSPIAHCRALFTRWR